MSNIKILCNDINNVCKKIAERDGFKLPPVGGWYIENNKWIFVDGAGRYVKKNGAMQWKLYEIESDL